MMKWMMLLTFVLWTAQESPVLASPSRGLKKSKSYLDPVGYDLMESFSHKRKEKKSWKGEPQFADDASDSVESSTSKKGGKKSKSCKSKKKKAKQKKSYAPFECLEETDSPTTLYPTSSPTLYPTDTPTQTITEHPTSPPTTAYPTATKKMSKSMKSKSKKAKPKKVGERGQKARSVPVGQPTNSPLSILSVGLSATEYSPQLAIQSASSSPTFLSSNVPSIAPPLRASLKIPVLESPMPVTTPNSAQPSWTPPGTTSRSPLETPSSATFGVPSHAPSREPHSHAPSSSAPSTKAPISKAPTSNLPTRTTQDQKTNDPTTVSKATSIQVGMPPFHVAFSLPRYPSVVLHTDQVVELTLIFLDDYFDNTFSMVDATVYKTILGARKGSSPGFKKIEFIAAAEFGSSSAYVPSPTDLAVLLTTAFTQPASETFILMLENLPASNPFSQVDSVSIEFSQTKMLTPEAPTSGSNRKILTGAFFTTFLLTGIIAVYLRSSRFLQPNAQAPDHWSVRSSLRAKKAETSLYSDIDKEETTIEFFPADSLSNSSPPQPIFDNRTELNTAGSFQEGSSSDEDCSVFLSSSVSDEEEWDGRGQNV